MKAISSYSKIRYIACSLLFSCGIFLPAEAQKVLPLAYYIDSNGYQKEVTSIDEGEAPLTVTFRACPVNLGSHTPSYEWHFRKMDANNSTQYTEMFIRYEENTEYTFKDSGTFHIVLKTSLDPDDIDVDSVTIPVVIVESKLEFPNAFSPNGDGINDTFKAKDGWKSIVEFKAIILSRWGQKLYEWNHPSGSWNGKYNGHDVKEGVYFLLVKAKGADGHQYDIRRDINLIRGYTNESSSSE